MNSDENKLVETYFERLPEDALCVCIDFMENNSLRSLGLSAKVILMLVQSTIDHRKDGLLIFQVINELGVLKKSGTRSAKEDYLQTRIDEIIINIQKTGKLYNFKNTRLLSGSITRLSLWSSKYIIYWLYQDAKALRQQCSHLLPFLMNSLASYLDYRRLLDLTNYRYADTIIVPTNSKECLISLYYFLEKHKDYSSKIAAGESLEPFNIQRNMIDLSFQMLEQLCTSTDEKALVGASEQYIHACIRVYTVLLHQQHYRNSDGGPWGDSLWKNVDLGSLQNAKRQALTQNTAHAQKIIIIVDRVQAGILASLLTCHYLESGVLASIVSVFNPSDKSVVNKVVKNLIRMREGELSTEYLDVFKDDLVVIAQKDKKLYELLKYWNIASFDIWNGNRKDYALNFDFKRVQNLDVKRKAFSELPSISRPLAGFVDSKFKEKKTSLAVPHIPETKKLIKTSLLISAPAFLAPKSSAAAIETKAATPEAGLLKRLNLDLALSADVKQIDIHFLQSSTTRRILQGQQLKKVYHKIDKIFKEMDQLAFIAEAPLYSLLNLEAAINDTKILLAAPEDSSDPEINKWVQKLEQLSTHIDYFKGLIEKHQKQEAAKRSLKLT